MATGSPPDVPGSSSTWRPSRPATCGGRPGGLRRRAGRVRQDHLAAALAELDRRPGRAHGRPDGGLGRPRRHRRASSRSVVEPLAEGRAGAYRHYNWHLDRFDREVAVPVAPWLVVEGVGSGNPVDRGPRDRARLGRGRRRPAAGPRPGARRPGDARPMWRQFMADETAGLRRATGRSSGPTCWSTGRAPGRPSCVRRAQSPDIDWRATISRSSRTASSARGAVRALDAHHRRRLAVGQVEGHPGRARRQVHRDDLRPVVLPAAVAVDHDQPVRVRLDPGPQQAVEQRERQQPQHQQRAALEQREPLPGLGVEREPRERADDEQPGADRDADDPRRRAGAR